MNADHPALLFFGDLYGRAYGDGLCPPLQVWVLFAPKLVYLRVRDTAHGLPCGRDWSTAGGVPEQGALDPCSGM